MTCSHINDALLEGRLRTAAEDAHVASCPACQALLAGMTQRGALSASSGTAAPIVPSTRALNAAVQRQRTREWLGAGSALAAAAVLVTLLWPAAPMPPAAPLVAEVPDAGTPAENVAADKGDTAAPLPDDATPGHAGLLALLDGLDGLDRPAEPLPGDDLVALLDPYPNRSTPVYDPFDFNQGDL